MGETFNYKGKGKYAQKKQGFTRASGGKFDGMPNWGSVLKGGLGALGMLNNNKPLTGKEKVANLEKHAEKGKDDPKYKKAYLKAQQQALSENEDANREV